MKKSTILLLCIINIYISAQAQTIDTIPNGGFEHWEGEQNCQYYIPKPWENYCTHYTGFIFSHFPPPPFPPYKDTATLYLQSGPPSDANFVEQTFIMHSRPKSFSMLGGYQTSVQWAGFNVIVLMLKGKDTIAYNSESSDPKSYRNTGSDTILPFDFVFPIKYYSSKTPDYCYIRLNSASKQYTKNPSGSGGNFFADDVKFLDTLVEKGVWHPDTTTHTDTTKHTSINYDIAQSPPPQMNVWPNPSSGDVTFSFRAMGSGMHTLYIYDITGRLVATPVKQSLQSGKDALTVWECVDCNSGIYTCVLQSPGGAVYGRVVLMK